MQREDKITANKNEEVFQLKDHSEKLLTQIKKLNKDKKFLENKVQQLMDKDPSKSSNMEIQVEEKGTNTDPINFRVQKSPNPIEAKAYLDVTIQTMKIPSEDFVTKSKTAYMM